MRDRKDLPVPRGRVAPRGRRAQPARVAKTANADRSGRSDRKVRRATVANLAHGTTGIRLVQNTGDTLTCNEGEVLASVRCGDGATATVTQNRSAKCAAGGVVGICMRQ